MDVPKRTITQHRAPECFFFKTHSANMWRKTLRIVLDTPRWLALGKCWLIIDFPFLAIKIVDKQYDISDRNLRIP